MISTVSIVFGWIYFVLWTLSYWPQVILNHKRKSTEGLAMDYVYLNFMGFISYSIFNFELYSNKAIQNQYTDRFNSLNKVQLSDVLFSAHALIPGFALIIQSFLYKGYKPMSKLVMTILGGIIIVSGILFALVWANVVIMIDVLYFFSYLKMFSTLSKYLPQIYFNFRRKTTKGFSMDAMVLDFFGGLFLTAQQIVDCMDEGNMSPITGNLVKVLLGVFSMINNLILILQKLIYGRRQNNIQNNLEIENEKSVQELNI